MTLSVSRGSVSVDGQKPCSRCGIRPQRKGQRYCRPCQTEYTREWRAGRVSMMVTPEERALLLAHRRERDQ